MSEFIPKQKVERNGRNLSIKCPHCSRKAYTFGAIKVMSETVQHRHMRCTNELCSASFTVQFAILLQTQPPVVLDEPLV